MAEIRKNVVWTDREMTQIARFMIDAMARDGQLSLLQAVRLAQDSLGKGRQRNIQAWSMVEPKIGPKLDGLRSAGGPAGAAAAQTSEASAEVASAESVSDTVAVKTDPEPRSSRSTLEPQPVIDELDALDISSLPPMRVFIHGVLQPDDEIATAAQPPAMSPSDALGELPTVASSPVPSREPVMPFPEPSRRSEKPFAEPLKPTPALDPLQFEAALLVAFQSPVVERALADLMGAAMAQAFARFTASQGNPAPAEEAQRTPGVTQGRVLVAGFPDSQAKAMVSAMEGAFEVRVWKAHQTPQMLAASARICTLAIVPEDAPDDFQEHLAGLGLKVLRHEGSVGRLAERVSDALE